MIAEFEAENERYYKASWKAQFISGLIMPLMNLVKNIGIKPLKQIDQSRFPRPSRTNDRDLLSRHGLEAKDHIR